MQFGLIVAIAALGGLLFGYDTGVISGALLFIRDVFHLSATMQGVVAGVALLGATVGAAGAGVLSDRFGRRTVILVTGLIFVAGSAVSALAGGLGALLAGRLLVGLAIGVSSMVTPLYLAEVAPAESRGSVVSLNQFLITLGIVVSYLVGYLFATVAEGWRWMLAGGVVPGTILFLGMLALPESPRWLAGHGRAAEAEAVLRRLRGGRDHAAELAELRSDLKNERGRLARWADLLAPAMRRPLVIGIGLAVFQQITGINTVIYFAPTIFQSAGLSSASVSILATAGVGAVNVAMTLVAMWLLDRVGRRVLLMVGLVGMAATLCVLAGAFYVGAGGSLAALTVGALAAYVGCFAIGLGPVFWLLIAEIFPLALRGRAMSLATVANWGFNLLVTLTFLNLVELFGQTGVFLLYAALTAAAFVFVLRLVPETKGRSLEQIEAELGVSAPA